ncbi:MAG: phosphoenolpyruvate--protein phosphotransferase [Planctomycetes bacterium]|nr:phosphoenolpyruvate--protein phosphotransferase [Planctomycetota bacterium]
MAFPHPNPAPRASRGKVQGTAVAPGLALGSVQIVLTGPLDVPTWSVKREDVPFEIGRLAAALNAAAERLEERQRAVAATAGAKDAEIFAVHRMILKDPHAMGEVEHAISEQRINAEAAVKLLIERYQERFSKLEGDNVRNLGSDVSDPWRYVLNVLLERDREQVLQADERVILAAAELTPAVVTFLERERLLAVIAETGGRFSHGAVLARSLGLPSVVGLPNLLARLEQGMQVAVDGDRGTVLLAPTEAQVTDFQERKRSLESRRESFRAEAGLPGTTLDGRSISVQVNVESVRDLDTFDLAHTDGIGLLRTEFLYLERNEFPSEEEQYRLYRRVLERMGGRPTTLRLLDIGGDKPLPYFQTPSEANPALGWRGIRITLRWRDLLRVQLRALLRSSTAGDLRILMPMISSLEEVREVRSLFAEIRSQLGEQGYPTADDVPVGAMIEVPSALLELERIVREVDFVSVGTNDLVQYLLAADRDNPWVSGLYDPHHPAVVRALAQVAEVAVRAGKSCSVCGEMASDPAVAVLLLGFGYDSVSVAPQFVPEIKYAVRHSRHADLVELAAQVLAQDTAQGVRAQLDRVRRSAHA